MPQPKGIRSSEAVSLSASPPSVRAVQQVIVVCSKLIGPCACATARAFLLRLLGLPLARAAWIDGVADQQIAC